MRSPDEPTMHNSATMTSNGPSPAGPPSPWLRKPLWVVLHQESSANEDDHHHVKSHLTLWDLVSVGVGGTVGSGIFVLSGYIAHNWAGPATTMSFAIAGLAACCSGVSYAELAGRIPGAGSTYVYAYVGMGELPAVLAAACLTLEYAVAGAAVARSWGDKVVEWLVQDFSLTGVESYLKPGYGFNPMALVVSAACVALLMDGVQESKRVTNFFTITKVGLVVFMIVGGFILTEKENLEPFVPLGASGVLRGATSSFFGYIGFDEVCCIASEALHPQRDMPRAVLLTLAIVTVLYVSAALALTGMQPYTDLSDTSPFPAAFRYNSMEWAAQISAAGEVLTFPVVVLISLMAQPRLQFALAQDGLLPDIFGQVDEKGNLRSGVCISGIAMTVVATFVPFGYLDDLISSGILFAFSMTNTCLVLMRLETPPDEPPHRLGHSLLMYNGLCFISGLLMCHVYDASPGGALLALASCCVTAAMVGYIAATFPKSASFGGSMLRTPSRDAFQENPVQPASFRTPLVPYLPCLGIFVNWYLIAQLEALGLFLLVLYLSLAALLYLWFGAKNSVGNMTGWRLSEFSSYESVTTETDFVETPLSRTISLQRVKHESEQRTNGLT